MADVQAVPDQIDHILGVRPEAEVDNPNWRQERDYGFIYRRGHFITRPGDAERAGRELRNFLTAQNNRNEDQWRREPGLAAQPPDPQVRIMRNLPGSRLMRFSNGLDDDILADPRVPDCLDALDATLGTGVIRPDHILTSASHACSATEPEETAGAPGPTPVPVSPGCTCGHCTGAGVLVSIIDTGLVDDAAKASPWLEGVDGDRDPLGPQGEILEYTGHGTFSAGCLRTISPQVQAYVERGVQHGGAAFESELAAQFAEGLQRNPDIVVFCFAADTRKELSLLGFDAVFDDYVAHTKGITVLAPAGNEGTRKRKYPAASRSVIGVGALSEDLSRLADFSGRGGWVDVFAPGENLVNAFATGEYVCNWAPDKGKVRRFAGQARWSGTSFSAPIVAGMIANRMSATGENADDATRTLLSLARSQTRRGLGPVLLPGQGCPGPGHP